MGNIVIDNIKAICNVFNISTDELLDYNNELVSVYKEYEKSKINCHNIMFCVNSNLLKLLLLNPSTLSVAISLSISVNESNPKLYKTMAAKIEANKDNT